MKRYQVVLAVTIAGALAWGGYRAYRAHANLVTLNVRNMEVRRAISKIEWQTWERIIVNKDVSGQVTIHVRNVPLEEVLGIIGLQTDSRWRALYPIYRGRTAGLTFRKVVRGDVAAAGSGWSTVLNVPAWQRGGGNGFGNTVRAANKLVSAQFQSKDLGFAALALSRFSQAQVIPEDGAGGTINLKLEQAPFERAVAQVAKQVHRKWDKIYAIQPLRAVVVARPDGEPRNGNVPPPTIAPEENPEAQKRDLEAFLATMTPDERQKVQAQIATMEQIRALPPAERQQRMQEMASQASQASQADLLQRIQNRLKNGTPDQRVAADRRRLQNQQRAPKQ